MNFPKAAVTAIVAVLGYMSPGSAVLAQTASAAAAAPISIKPNLPTKKIIEVGWDQFYKADPAYIRDNIREMEKRPFDGIIFCLPDLVAGFENGGRVFHVQGWNEEKLKPQLKVLSEIKWDKFTDNFLTMFAASTMDWFNDEHWQTVLAHTRFMAQAAKTARCKGLLFDPEPYGDNPWRYDQQLHFKTKSFEEYAVKARQRGRQFMQAIETEGPGLKMLMLYQYSLFSTYASNSTDPIKRNEAFNKNEYGLFAYFLDGMLEAASEKVKFIDGNEFSYYYKSPLEFYRSYHGMRQGAKQAVAPELRAKFDSHTEAAQALYLDYLFNLRPENHKTSPAITMTPDQRLRWFEHNAYYALKTSDEYVWMWSEEFNWYNNKAIRGTAQPAELTAAIEAALVSAKGKIARGEELGFDIETDTRAAESKRAAQQQARLTRRTVDIAPVPVKGTPVIDGKLDDALYAKVKPLQAFIGLYNPAGITPQPQAATQAWVAYDAKNLYLAFRCAEPKMRQLKRNGTARDGEVARR